MVCMDGFVLTHAVEEIDVPDQDTVDAVLPAFVPRQYLDPDDPVTIGAMVGPEAFTEVKYLMALEQLRALDEIPLIQEAFETVVGRSSGGLVREYRMEDAEVAVVAMGSVLGSIEDVVDDLRQQGVRIGVVGVKCFRPWPLDEVRAALRGVDQVVVVNRAIAVESGSILGQDVRLTLAGSGTRVYDVVAGLGGRPVTRVGLRALLDDLLDGRLVPDRLLFVDVDEDRIGQELHRLHLPPEAVDQLRARHLGSANQVMES